MRFDGRGNHAAGIDPIETQSFPITAKTLEVPPRNSILCADDCGVRPEYRLQLRRKLRQAVCLHSKKDDVHRSHFFEGTGDCGLRHEISLDTFYLHAALLHGAKMRPAREERDIQPGLRHACTEVGSDGARPRNQESHRWSSKSAAATARRRIFPVAVVGILSTR